MALDANGNPIPDQTQVPPLTNEQAADAAAQQQPAAPDPAAQLAEVQRKLAQAEIEKAQLAAVNQQILAQQFARNPSPMQQQQMGYQQPQNPQVQAPAEDPRVTANRKFIQDSIAPVLAPIIQANQEIQRQQAVSYGKQEVENLYQQFPNLPIEIKSNIEQAYLAAKAQGLALNNGQPIDVGTIAAIEFGRYSLSRATGQQQQVAQQQQTQVQQQAQQAAAAQQRVVNGIPATTTITTPTAGKAPVKSWDQMSRQERRDALADHKF